MSQQLAESMPWSFESPTLFIWFKCWMCIRVCVSIAVIFMWLVRDHDTCAFVISQSLTCLVHNRSKLDACWDKMNDDWHRVTMLPGTDPGFGMRAPGGVSEVRPADWWSAGIGVNGFVPGFSLWYMCPMPALRGNGSHQAALWPGRFTSREWLCAAHLLTASWASLSAKLGSRP